MPFLNQYKSKKQDKKSFNAAKTAPSNSVRRYLPPRFVWITRAPGRGTQAPATSPEECIAAANARMAKREIAIAPTILILAFAFFPPSATASEAPSMVL